MHLSEEMQKRILIDFDGTVATYNGWQGNDKIGEPVPYVHDAFKALTARGYKIFIHSTRAKTTEGHMAISGWLVKHGLLKYVSAVTYLKHGAFCYIDDRAIKFEGNWPLMLHKISGFKSWAE